MEEEKAGITLADIFRTIFSQKWLALAITVIITLAITFGLYFGYNPNTTQYVSTFTVSFPGSEGSSPKFPDNSPFKFIEIISLNNLNAAKASDEERFGYINVGAIHLNNDISIIHPKNSAGEEEERFYTIKVSSKYFKNRTDATDFIDALVQMPINYLLGLADDQAAYLVDYDETVFYEDKTDILTSQVEYLIKGATALAENTGNSTATMQILGALNRYKIELQVAIGKMRENHYVHNIEEAQSIYHYLLNNVRETLALKEEELKEIRKGGLDETDDTIIVQTSTKIEQIAEEISKLHQQEKLYSDYLDEMTESDEFDEELNKLVEDLKTLTVRFSNNLREFYNRYSFIAYNGATETESSLSLVVCGLVGLIAGLIVAAITAFIVGSKRSKKIAPKTENAENEDIKSE